MQMKYPTLGKKIRFFRLRANISQQEIENEIGLSSGTMSRIENGETNPTKETLFKIMKLFNLGKLENEYLVGRLQYPPTEKEISDAKEELSTYFKKPNVMAYLVDDRFRIIEASDSFSRLMNISSELKENQYLGNH